MANWDVLKHQTNFYLFSSELSCGHKGEGVFEMDNDEFLNHHSFYGRNSSVVCPLCNLKVRVKDMRSKRIEQWDVEDKQIGVNIRKSFREFYEKRIR